MSGENLQKKTHPSTSNVPFSTKLQTCGTAPKILTLVAKYTSPKKKHPRSEFVFGRFFLFFCWKLGEDGVFCSKKNWKRLSYFLVFFLFWWLFEVGFWRHQQLISRMDEEDLICNMSTTKSTKRSLALQEMIYQICEVLVTVSESWQEKPLLFTIFQAEISF